eukprot:TRINITY_DN2206_c0_g1_i1.p1 TRINITY_DN2206_c0_g1~~TRINITY_DN2206_c0_g1_i1.p1  ORF type:complete len:465 (+),score=48.62 TRINITY_DN2206_c0_g1_i1:492-1886(+)
MGRFLDQCVSLVFAEILFETHYNSKHIAVVSYNQYYSFDVLDNKLKRLNEEDIARHLQEIIEDSWKYRDHAEESINPIGLLTTENRDTWAKHYGDLKNHDPINAKSLSILNSAMFLVCLDDATPSGLEETSRWMLHADGRNRWFDKSIQLIICQNGKSGINMEHTGMDGHTVLRYATDIYNHSVRNRCTSPITPSSSSTMPQPVTKTKWVKLEWVIPSSVKAGIERAGRKINKFISTTSTEVLHFTGYGRRFIMNHKMSPDALIQMSFQLAYYKLHAKLAGSTYESVMVKGFYHGRTECCRTLTPEVVRFIETFSDITATPVQQIQALKRAVKQHGSVIKACKTGNGVDRHLYGLFWLSKQQQQRYPGYELPEIFNDVGWSRLRHDVLSTSNCGGYALSLFGFGPVVDDGFGIGYIIKDSCMHFNITSFHKQAHAFSNALNLSLLEIGSLLEDQIPVRSIKPRL